MQNEIHYFSIVNSLMITLFLTGVVAMIMLRTLRKDISTYNEVCVLVVTCAFSDKCLFSKGAPSMTTVYTISTCTLGGKSLLSKMATQEGGRTIPISQHTTRKVYLFTRTL